MPRPFRLPLVALLAAVAALLAPLGAGPAAGVAASARSAVAGAAHATPAGASYGIRHKAARETRDGVVGRAHRERSHVQTGQPSRSSTTVATAVAGVLLLGLLVAAAGWWSRRNDSGQFVVDRTVARSRGRGPPALRCA